eukprot:226453_1
MAESDSNWNEIDPPPFTFFTKIFVINEGEFVTVSPGDNLNNYKHAIYVFNKQNNKWNKIFVHQQQFRPSMVAYDKAHQAMYLGSYGKLLKFDIKNRTLSKLSEISDFYTSPRTQLIFAQNNLHKIGIDTCVYDDVMKKFNQINQQNIPVSRRSALKYLKSQKCLLSFGAGQYLRYNNSWYQNYSVYQFSFVDRQWTNLNVKIPTDVGIRYSATCKSEEYILLLGGGDGYSTEFVDDILIYDTKNRSFTKSKIRCPHKDAYFGAITNDGKHDEMLCFGFVNDCYKANNFGDVQLLPFALVQLVNSYFCHEELHLFEKQGKRHWKINIDVILQCQHC